MLGFIESPIALIAMFIVVLICFGPNKVPEIANQIGRALGEFKRATTSFQQSVNNDIFDPMNSYKQTNYDSYGNPSEYSSTSDEISDNSTIGSTYPSLPEAAEEEEKPRGDFAAAAFSDDQYGAG